MTCDWRMGHDFGVTVYEGKPCRCGAVVVSVPATDDEGVVFSVQEAAQ